MSALAPQGEALSIGATGVEVRAVHRYLTEFGYLPNAALQGSYPQWRSPDSSAPVRDDVYDERTAEAVRAFQRAFGLPESGVIDDESRRILLAPRCGVPEMTDLDESNKWDITSSDWSSTNVTWGLMHTNGQCEVNPQPGCITQAQAEAAIAAAFATWQVPSRHTFSKAPGSPGFPAIEIRFTPTRPDGSAWDGAFASTTPAGGDIYIDSNRYFSTASPTPSGNYDLQSIVLHEIGHAIKIQHSSVIQVGGASLPVMYPGIEPGVSNRSLLPDDNVAALAKGLTWQEFRSNSFDIDVDDGPTYSVIFVLTTPAIAGGYTVSALANGAWSTIPGQGAVRIGSNGGLPWIVQDDGDIYQWDVTTSSWSKRSGCAKDIAVGSDNSVWILGCNQASYGGYRVHKWNGTSFDGDYNDIGGVRITVGPRTPGGPNQPWVVMNDGMVLRRNSADIGAGNWYYLPGDTSTLGTDIAAGSAGNIWMIGKTPQVGGFKIYVWNEQDAWSLGNPSPAKQARWILVPGHAVTLSVDSTGYPYVINNANNAHYVK